MIEAGGSKFGCGFGSSGPRILGLRLTLARFFVGRTEDVSGLIGVLISVLPAAGGVLEGALALVFGRCCALLAGGDVRGVAGGGVGDEGLVLAFLAFLLRIFSSSSEDVTSESLVLWSTLMVTESRLFLELAPNDGARFSGRLVPANESERMIR